MNGKLFGKDSRVAPHQAKADLMESQVFLQLASTFVATPIVASLQAAVAGAGVADGIYCTQYTQISEFLISSSTDSTHSVGTLVLLRIEDWLRTEFPSSSSEATLDTNLLRSQLRSRADEFVSQLAILSENGNQVWFLGCPSTGWFAEQHKLSTLCRTYTNLIATRVRMLPGVTTVNWPTTLTAGQYEDPAADQFEQIPFTQSAFDQLGEYLGSQIAYTMTRAGDDASPGRSNGPSALAAYLEGLNLQVRLASASVHDRAHVDRILRSTASFSLTGEKPSITDEEIDKIFESRACTLVNVSDRLSDYGPSGLVLSRSVDDALVLSAMALSCTVLGKQVEHAVVTALTQIAVERQLNRIVFEYMPTKRNQPILSFLRSIGEEESGNRYVLPIQMAEARIKAAAVSAGAWSVSHTANSIGELSRH